jgi:mono/diheme cytochrome c family protein
MPGTSMQPFDELGQEERMLLTEEVLRMQREGMREQLINTFQEEEEEIDEQEVRQIVEECTTPGQLVRVPPIGPADPPAIARGREIYLKAGCDNCHGEDGRGEWDTPLFDDEGLPTAPRDLAREPFKGGDQPESVYLRVFLGMPGTPHPGAFNLPEHELIDLVHFCRSLARGPKREQTNFARGLLAASRGYLAAPAQPAAPSSE